MFSFSFLQRCILSYLLESLQDFINYVLREFFKRLIPGCFFAYILKFKFYTRFIIVFHNNIKVNCFQGIKLNHQINYVTMM